MTSTRARNTTAKTTAKKPPAAKPATKRTPRPPRKTTTAPPALSLVKTPAPFPTRDTPEFIAELQIAAYHAAKTHGLPHGLIRDWRQRPDGTAARTFPSGALLAYTPDDNSTAPFHAFTPCAQGAHHSTPIHTPHDLRTAAAHAVNCHTRHYTPKQTAADAVQATKKTTTTTQPLPLAAIADGLAARTSDAETAKEHPQP
jgi:hypothetical protein